MDTTRYRTEFKETGNGIAISGKCLDDGDEVACQQNHHFSSCYEVHRILCTDLLTELKVNMYIVYLSQRDHTTQVQKGGYTNLEPTSKSREDTPD